MSVIKEPTWDGVPANVRRLLKSCLEKDPKQRLRDIGDAWRLLENAAGATARSPSRAGIIAIGALAAVTTVVASALAFLHFREKPLSTEVVRFQIFPPDKSSFAGNDAANISPDGRHVAFQLRNPASGTQLWVRSLDSLESKPLTGTEGVLNASFWSPDSRSIGFSVQGKLKKVNISSGSAQTVCNLPVTGEAGLMRAGAWSRDGVILFGTAISGCGEFPTEPPRWLPAWTPRKEGFSAGPSSFPTGAILSTTESRPATTTTACTLARSIQNHQQSSQRLLAGGSQCA